MEFPYWSNSAPWHRTLGTWHLPPVVRSVLSGTSLPQHFLLIVVCADSYLESSLHYYPCSGGVGAQGKAPCWGVSDRVGMQIQACQTSEPGHWR